MAMITLNKARNIVRRTMGYGKEQELKPLCVVVLDAGGHVIAAERADGASPGRYDVAFSKAYGAVMLGMSGQAQKARAEQQAYFINAVNGVFGGKLVPVPGGVLVLDKKENVIGAVGVSGDTSENDEAAAIEGIDAVGLTARA